MLYNFWKGLIPLFQDKIKRFQNILSRLDHYYSVFGPHLFFFLCFESENACIMIATATDSSCHLASCCSRRRGAQRRECCCSSFFAYKQKTIPSIEIDCKHEFAGCTLSPTWLNQKN
ncbi:unnamed protein product [Brugia pahangi]|uniref:Secreted protein n=1 Tax=Brugia pahangi TaxID=6280 RepID=A0A0N4T5V2_BRUPA|nr:unnamed protein product [Brugia pahangi]